ncbi:MAG: AAA family ATPase [Bacteroidetes bacterium]|nr:MAG: AAA family ATPase [Bacteroidota bacterium]
MLGKSKWPLSIWDFETLRRGGYHYIDKTELVWQLANTLDMAFLSRPRRFGKSMLTTTLKCYFEGKQELFEGLRLAELEAQKGEGAWQKHPVLRFDMSESGHSSLQDLEELLNDQLRYWENTYGVCFEGGAQSRLRQLIQHLACSRGTGVVILIDEYDNPLTHTIEPHKAELHAQYKEVLRGFYSVLKGEMDKLRFVLLTGITQFQHLSLFSGLNNLFDISLTDEYNAICGVTHEELHSTFGEEIEALAKRHGVGRGEMDARLKELYDGFRFSPGGEEIYNPFSIIRALGTGRLKNYWFNSGLPYVVQTLMPGYWYDFRKLDRGVSAGEEELIRFYPDNSNPVPILFQTGYLTVKGYDPIMDTFELGFPNEEVKYDFWKGLIPLVLGVAKDTQSIFHVRDFVGAINGGDIDGFLAQLKALVASIPYSSLDVKNRPPKEERYQVAIYLIFQLAGRYVRAEVHSAKGRSDIEVITPDAIYIFETKVHSEEHPNTAEGAIAQILGMEYAAPYLASEKRVVAIGLVYDGEETVDMGWKELKA